MVWYFLLCGCGLFVVCVVCEFGFRICLGGVGVLCVMVCIGYLLFVFGFVVVLIMGQWVARAVCGTG